MTIYQEHDGILEYIPTPDGIFERWIDEYYPSWEHADSGSIELWRDMWEAARAHYSQEVL